MINNNNSDTPGRRVVVSITLDRFIVFDNDGRVVDSPEVTDEWKAVSLEELGLPSPEEHAITLREQVIKLRGYA